MKRIHAHSHAQGTVLVKSGLLQPVACSVATQIVEFGKDVALPAQLFVSLDSGEEMGMVILDRATADVEQRRGQAEAMGKVQDRGKLQRDKVVVVGGGVRAGIQMLVIVVGPQRQFPGSGLPIDDVPDAQLLVVGRGQVAVPVTFHAAVIEKVLLLVGVTHHTLMGEVGPVVASIVSQDCRWCSLIDQEITHLGDEEATGELRLEEAAPCLIAHAGQVAVVVALMRPHALVFRVVQAVPEVHHAVAVAEREHPGAVGIVKLCVEVGHQVLFAVPADMPGVLIIHLSADHQPEVWGEDGGVEFDKSVGIAVTHLVAVVRGSGVVAANLGKEDGIVVEGVGVGEHEVYITVVGRMDSNQVRVEDLLFTVIKLLESLDEEPVVLADLPVQAEVQVLGQPTVCHTVHIGGTYLAVGGTGHGIALHRELLAPVGDIGVEHAIAVGAARRSHLTVGLHVFAIVDVYHTLRAAHGLCHRGVAANLDMVYLAGLHIGQERLDIYDKVNVVDTQPIILVNLLAIDGQEFGTGVQHVEQGHLAVGIHLIHMNHVAVALIFDDIIVVLSVGNDATHAQHEQKKTSSQVLSHVTSSHLSGQSRLHAIPVVSPGVARPKAGLSARGRTCRG